MEIPVPERYAEARPSLLPVLRRVTEPAQAWQAERADPANRLLRRPFLPLVSELVALDLPDVRLFVNQGHLARWEVGADAVLRQARENLAALATTGLRQRPEYGLWQLESGDGYEASRLMLHGWLAAFRGQVPGRPVAVVPAGRVLLVGGDGSDAQLDRLLQLAWDVFRTAGGPLSPVPYTVDDEGRVVPWSVPPDHPLHLRLDGAVRLLTAYEYANQRDVLLGQGLQPPSVRLVRKKATGESWTECRWSASAEETLLPGVDRVVLVDGEREVVVPFSALQRHARGCLEDTGLQPPIYKARWPAPGTLRELAAEALPPETP